MNGFLLLPQMAAKHASAAGMIGFCEQVSLHKSLSFDMGDVKPEKGLQGAGKPGPAGWRQRAAKAVFVCFRLNFR
jgi:hypothetical protein